MISLSLMAENKQDRMTQDNSAQTSTNDGGLRDLIQNRPGTARLLGVAIIIVATLIAYIPAMSASFIWDDDWYVSRNALLTNWEGLGRIWTDVFPRPAEYPLPQYYPLTHTSFWIEYHLWGTDADGNIIPTGFHITNIVLHICNAMLLWLLLKKLNVPGAWLAAAIFAVHPMNVETVAWVAERKNCLSILFFLASLYVYLRYARVIASPATADDESQWSWRLPNDPARLYALSAILFLCALFSKTISDSMPLVALLIIWWKRGKLTKDDLLPAIPLILVGAGMGMFTAHMELVRVGVGERQYFWNYAPTTMGNFAARVMIAGRVVWFYIGKLLLPKPLMFNYPRWNPDPSQSVMYVFAALALATPMVLFFLRKRIGTGPLVATLIFLGTLFPALGFVNVWPMQYSFVADHFAYLSGIAFITLLAAVLATYLSLEAVAALAVCVLLLFTGMSYVHAGAFADNRTLWVDTWEKSEHRSWMAANNYGLWVLDEAPIRNFEDRMSGAERWFRTAIKLKPDHVQARLNLARVAIFRAQAAQLMIDHATTQPAAGATTQVASPMPTTRPADFYAQALDLYHQAIDIEPRDADAQYYLAHLLDGLGRSEEAVEHYQAALDAYPRHAAALETLAARALQKNQYADASGYLQRLVAIRPESPRDHADYGTALMLSGRTIEGFAEWQTALSLAPNDPTLPNEFGVRMASAGEYGRARDYFAAAYQINPQSVEVLTNLGIVAAKLGSPQAKTFLEAAVKLDPTFTKASQAIADLQSGKLQPATRPSTAPSPTSLPAQ